MRTAGVAAWVRHTVSRKLEVGSRLRASWNFHRYHTIDSFYVNFRAQCCVNHTDVLLTENQITFTSEFFVCFDANIDIQVTAVAVSDSFSALTQPNCRAVVDTSWNLDRQRLLAALHSTAATNGTSFLRHLTATLTSVTHDRLLNRAKHRIHSANPLASTLAIGTGFHLKPWLGSGAVAMFTLVIDRKRQLHLLTKHRLFERQRYTRLHIPTARPTTAATSARATKELAKNITKCTIAKVKVDVLPLTKTAKPLKRIAASIAAARRTTNTSMTELVVALAFLLVF